MSNLDSKFDIDPNLLADGLPPQAVDDLRLMMRGALLAGDFARLHHDQRNQVTERSLGDLVTPLDIGCDRIIQANIQRSRPGDHILSEELGPNKANLGNRYWIVDPIDGTSVFSFNVSADMPSCLQALYQDGKVWAAVAYFMLSGELFYAVRGHGAYAYGSKDPMRCVDVPLDKAWVEMNQYSDASLESAPFRRLRETLRSPGGPRLVSSSPPHSGIGLRIAEGRKQIAAVVHDNGSKKVKQDIWDVEPVRLFVEEAGGVVVNLADGQPYDSEQPQALIMATSRRLAGEIIARSQPAKAAA